MDTLLWILMSTFLVSLISFVGILTLLLKEKLFERILLALVALSAGALMGGAFLHLMPEAVEKFASQDVFLYILAGFVLFFLIEKIFHWRHCHKGECPVHTFVYTNLVGDIIHNFIDGMIIATSFVVDIPLGIATTIAVTLHEIPQEIGDFGVLVHGGFNKIKALSLNFVVALTAIIGGIIGYYFSGYAENFMMLLLPFAAGGFIYISASDLVPEIRKETSLRKSLLTFGIFILGILIMYALKFIVHE